MRKLLAFLLGAQSWISMICFVLMSIFVLAGVVMRFILQIPFSWGEEISRYLMVVAITLGIGIGVREKTHLGVALIVDTVPPRVGFFMKCVAYAVNIFGYLFLTYFSYVFTARNHRFGQESPALALPMWIMYAVMTAGFLLSAVESVVSLVDFVRAGGEVKPDPGQEEQYLA